MANREKLIRAPRAPQDNATDRFYIYAMQSGDFIKVGMSSRLVKRFEDARLLNPDIRLVMYRTVTRNVAPAVERRIHELLAPWHHDREWFTAPLAEVRKAAKIAIAEGAKVERRDYALRRTSPLTEDEQRQAHEAFARLEALRDRPNSQLVDMCLLNAIRGGIER